MPPLNAVENPRSNADIAALFREGVARMSDASLGDMESLESP
jgi:hypothetical protein